MWQRGALRVDCVSEAGLWSAVIITTCEEMATTTATTPLTHVMHAIRLAASLCIAWIIPIRFVAAAAILVYGLVAASTFHGMCVLSIVAASLPVCDRSVVARWWGVGSAVLVLVLDIRAAWLALLHNAWRDSELRFRSFHITEAKRKELMKTSEPMPTSVDDSGDDDDDDDDDDDCTSFATPKHVETAAAAAAAAAAGAATATATTTATKEVTDGSLQFVSNKKDV